MYAHTTSRSLPACDIISLTSPAPEARNCVELILLYNTFSKQTFMNVLAKMLHYSCLTRDYIISQFYWSAELNVLN